MLTKMKQTPKMLEEKYTGAFLGGAPGREGLQAVSAWKQLGYDNPITLMKELQVQPNSGYALLGGGDISKLGWNPKTESVIFRNGYQLPWEQYKASWFSAGMNDTSSIGPVAKKLQEKMTLDRLKELGIGQYTNQSGQTLGVDPLTGKPIKR